MTADPLREFFGHDWFAEHFVRDLEEAADRLRCTADFLDGKAALLREQMKLADKAADAWLPIAQWPDRKYGHALIYDPRWGVTEGMRFDSGTWGLAAFNGQVMQANPTHFYAPGLPAPPRSSAELDDSTRDGS